MELPARHDAQSWPGRIVVDRDVEPLGVCVGVFADVATGATEWLEVEITGHGKALVPALDATDVDGQVWVQFTRHAVLHAPRMDSGQTLTTADNVALYRHYDVPYSSAVSDTVLPAGAHLPDTDPPAADPPAADERPVDADRADATDPPADLPVAALDSSAKTPAVMHSPATDPASTTPAPVRSGPERGDLVRSASPSVPAPVKTTAPPTDAAPRPLALQPELATATLTTSDLPAPPGATDAGATDPSAIDLGPGDQGASDLGADDQGATDLGATDLGATDPGAGDPRTVDPAATDRAATDLGTADVSAMDFGAVGSGGTTAPLSPALAQPAEHLDLGADADPLTAVPDLVDPELVGGPLMPTAPSGVLDGAGAANIAVSSLESAGATVPALSEPSLAEPVELAEQPVLVDRESAAQPVRLTRESARDAATSLLILAGVAVTVAAALRARDLRVLRRRTPAARAAGFAGQVLRRPSLAGRRAKRSVRPLASGVSRVHQQLTGAVGHAADGLRQAVAATGTGKISVTSRQRQFGAAAVRVVDDAVGGLGRSASWPLTAAQRELARRGRLARRSAARVVLRLGVVGAAAAGYVLGARAGRQRYQQISRQLTALSNSRARAAGQVARDPDRHGPAVPIGHSTLKSFRAWCREHVVIEGAARLRARLRARWPDPGGRARP